MNPQRGMDLTALSIAGVQTGFGAFVAAYLAVSGWTQGAIGAVLTVQTVASMVFQLPGGLLVDRVTARRALLAAGLAALAAAALLMAAFPNPVIVATALVLQSLGAALMTPAIVALSLRLAGAGGLGERLGRNARFAAIGSGAAAAIMGLVASVMSQRAVFLLAALLVLPALVGVHNLVDGVAKPAGRGVKAVLGRIRPRLRRGESVKETPIPVRALLRDGRLWLFAGCVVLFHASSAAVLVVAAADVTRRAGHSSGLFIAAFIIVPQIVVAAVSPAIGRAAQFMGRRRVLILGYASLPLRAIGFALLASPALLVPVQLLEGVSAAIYGVMLPLVAADLTVGTGRTNVYLGALGLCAATGAALSTLLPGTVAGIWDKNAAFWMLAALGLCATALVTWAMPETRPAENTPTTRQKQLSPGV
jgi:MFS family permease